MTLISAAEILFYLSKFFRTHKTFPSVITYSDQSHDRVSSSILNNSHKTEIPDRPDLFFF